MERKIIIVLLQLMIVLGMSGCKKEQGFLGMAIIAMVWLII